MGRASWDGATSLPAAIVRLGWAGVNGVLVGAIRPEAAYSSLSKVQWAGDVGNL